MIFKIPSSDHSIYKLTERGQTKQKIIQFQIFVDKTQGVRNLEIFDKKHISQVVESFALKYDIQNKSKIQKLKKYVKAQFNKEE